MEEPQRKSIKHDDEDAKSMPRFSNDNRQFLDADLKEENPEAQTSYYQMAFGGKPKRETPSQEKSDSEEDLESSSKTFGTITEQPFEEDAETSNRNSRPSHVLLPSEHAIEEDATPIDRNKMGSALSNNS